MSSLRKYKLTFQGTFSGNLCNCRGAGDVNTCGIRGRFSNEMQRLSQNFRSAFHAHLRAQFLVQLSAHHQFRHAYTFTAFGIESKKQGLHSLYRVRPIFTEPEVASIMQQHYVAAANPACNFVLDVIR